MEIVSGTSVSDALAIGPLVLWRRPELSLRQASGLLPEEELLRFDHARALAQEELERLASLVLAETGEDSAAILELHQMMLEDEDWLREVRERILDQGATAEFAAREAGEAMAVLFEQLEDEYLRARAADVRDIARRVIRILSGEEEQSPTLTRPSILLAEDLSPADTVSLDRRMLLGMVTCAGSSFSHTAILARARNIPALIGVNFDEGWDGRLAVLDGHAGTLTVDPTPEVLAAARRRLADRQARDASLQSLRGAPDVTLDGREVRLYANLGGPEELDAVLESDARGIGLLRSEFFFLGAQTCPTEEEQFAFYRQVAQAMAGKKVVIRTLDIGADKQAPCLPLEREDNPALGFRGIRLSLSRPELFRAQLRAILRAAAFGDVAVLLPMIVSVDEVRATRAILEDCREELRQEGIPFGEVELGVMIETPAAVCLADELAQEVDFFSLGTNDLTQFTLAMDRQNSRLDPFRDPCHPAILRMIRHTVEAGHRHGCLVGLCGELGADPALTEKLLRMGLDELSVSPASVLPLRSVIRSLDLSGHPVASP